MTISTKHAIRRLRILGPPDTAAEQVATWRKLLQSGAKVPDVYVIDVIWPGGDLWLFPAGFPHSIQGLQPNGCEFLLVFDEGDFSEDGTFLLSETIAHTPRNVLAKIFASIKMPLPKS